MDKLKRFVSTRKGKLILLAVAVVVIGFLAGHGVS